MISILQIIGLFFGHVQNYSKDEKHLSVFLFIVIFYLHVFVKSKQVIIKPVLACCVLLVNTCFMKS